MPDMPEELHPEFCPVHGDPDDPLNAWGCPVATEDDPPEAETCPHFVAEIERRIDDFRRGNFYEVVGRTEEGQVIFQEYFNHERIGPPTTTPSD